jgi:hypothetical protein
VKSKTSTTLGGRAADVHTFSGTHPFRAEHAGDNPRVVALIEAERCPRCEGALYPDGRVPAWQPAGSRATACRCIPVCEDCAHAEALGGLVSILAADAGVVIDHAFPAEFEVDPTKYLARTMLLSPEQWPVDRDRMIAGCERVDAFLEQQSEVVEVRLDDLVERQHPGGWCDPDN